jgi:hypothetical protein
LSVPPARFRDLRLRGAGIGIGIGIGLSAIERKAASAWRMIPRLVSGLNASSRSDRPVTEYSWPNSNGLISRGAQSCL